MFHLSTNDFECRQNESENYIVSSQYDKTIDTNYLMYAFSCDSLCLKGTQNEPENFPNGDCIRNKLREAKIIISSEMAFHYKLLHGSHQTPHKMRQLET